MIRGRCETKFTEYVWPTTFVAVPEVGSYVLGCGKDDIAKVGKLKVTEIHHGRALSHDNAMNRDYWVPSITVILSDNWS